MSRLICAILSVSMLHSLLLPLADAGFIRMSGEVIGSDELPDGFSSRQRVYISFELPADLTYFSAKNAWDVGAIFESSDVNSPIFKSFDIGSYDLLAGSAGVDMTKFNSFYTSSVERSIAGVPQIETSIISQLSSVSENGTPGISLNFNVTDEVNTFEYANNWGIPWEREWNSEVDLQLKIPSSEVASTVFNEFYIVQMHMLLDQSTGEYPNDPVFSLDAIDGQNRLVFDEIVSETFVNGASLTLMLRPLDNPNGLSDAELIKSVSFELKLVEIYSVPEPSSVVLLGGVSLAGYFYRRKKRKGANVAPGVDHFAIR